MHLLGLDSSYLTLLELDSNYLLAGLQLFASFVLDFNNLPFFRSGFLTFAFFVWILIIFPFSIWDSNYSHLFGLDCDLVRAGF